MPTKEELLEIHTHKLEGYDVSKRVFYSLHTENDVDFSKTKTIKLVGLLMSKLYEKGVLTDEEIDDMLLESVY